MGIFNSFAAIKSIKASYITWVAANPNLNGRGYVQILVFLGEIKHTVIYSRKIIGVIIILAT